MIFAIMILLTALLLSSVAAFYSVTGLIAIFPGSVWAIIIMGGTLEVSKIAATVWLHKYWHRATIQFKLYLVPAIAVLMIITSMGIFGYLSSSHVSQSASVGDITAQVQIFDEKIATERTNIDANKKALTQMDAQVDQLLSRTTDDKGATKAAQLRKSQSKERKSLQDDIAKSQKNIVAIQAERTPIVSQARKATTDVGPVLYIAALIYGDNPDANLLERAIRWVIILIVFVFDPLAIVLILAADQTIEWAKEDKQKKKEEAEYEADNGPLTDHQIETIKQASGIDQDLPNGAHLFVTEEEFFARGKEIARQADKIAQMEAELAASKQQQDEDPLDLWNKLLAAAEQPTESAQPITLPPQPHVWTTTIYPPVTDTEVTDIEPLAGYVQNEEQAESGLWQDISLAGQISEQEYYAKAAERTIEELVASVREGRLPLDKVPDEIRAQVTEKLENDR